MKRSFTLIELLVVVAIIAILVSILMPSLLKAREKSKRMVCLSQLSQTGSAKHLYLKDNNFKIHSRVPAGSDTHPGKQWMGMKGISKPWPARVSQRPLNIYLGHTQDGTPLPIALCPLEYKGLDAYKKTGSSYYGASSPYYDSLINKFTFEIEKPATSILITEAGAIAYAEQGLKYKKYFRLNHKDNKMMWSVLTLDNSAKEHTFKIDEGRLWQSDVANFTVFD